MNRKELKLSLARVILASDDDYHGFDLDRVVLDVFYSTSTYSMRVSGSGFKTFVKLGSQPHKHTLSARVNSKELIFLSQTCDYPYYLEKLDVLWLFSDRESMMLDLCGNDLGILMETQLLSK
jgi:hypothetical protein